jgi:hypothetical protein
MRPGFFARWVFGDSQPMGGHPVYEMNPEDLITIQKQILFKYIDKAKAVGMIPNPFFVAKLKAAEALQSKPHVPYVAIPETQPPAIEQNPEPQSIQTSAPVSQTASAPRSNPSAPQISPELDRAIKEVAQATIKDGGDEYEEGRQLLNLDLNGDGQEDAIVLFTIEGEGGAQVGYQYLAAIYHEENGWKPQATIGVEGSATGLTQAGPDTFNLNALTLGPDDALCCPTLEVPQKYRWVGDHFVQIGKIAK